MDLAYLYTSFDGRINRKPYWLAAILLAVILTIIFLIIGFAGGISFGAAGFGFLLLVTIIQLVSLYPSAALMVKRLHDRNRPGYFAAFLLVPIILLDLTNLVGITGNPLHMNVLDYLLNAVIVIIAIWFLIELGFLRGTSGPNQYGPDPLAAPAQ